MVAKSINKYYTVHMNNDTEQLEGYELFDNSDVTKVVNKITITKSNQINFPAAFYKLNKIDGKKGAALYYNKTKQSIAIRFTDETDSKGFKLILSNGGKYGAYLSAKGFFTLNGIDNNKLAGRYDYKKTVLNNSRGELFIVDLAKPEGGTM